MISNQKGRYIAENVICTTTDAQNIAQGIHKAVSAEFKAIADTAKSPYDMGCVPSEQIVKTMLDFVNSDNHTVKIFYDGE